MAQSPFQSQADLTRIAIAFKNDKYIADEIFPREKVGKDEYEYDEFPLNQSLRIMDDRVGRLGQVNQIVFESERKNGKCEDHYLESPIPQKDIDNADAHQNPLKLATEGTAENIELNREARVKDIVFNPNTYLPHLQEVVSGTSLWDHPDSKPILQIQAAKVKMLRKPNIFVIGENAWLKMQTNSQLVEAYFGTGAKEGIVPKEAVARLLGFDKILVGESRVDPSVLASGSISDIEYLWGNHAALIFRNPIGSLKNYSGNATFGMTAVSGTRYAGTHFDINKGGKGSTVVRVGECCEEKVLAAFCGYFFQNVVSS